MQLRLVLELEMHVVAVYAQDQSDVSCLPITFLSLKTVLLRICSKGKHRSATAVLSTAIALEFLGRGLVPFLLVLAVNL